MNIMEQNLYFTWLKCKIEEEQAKNTGTQLSRFRGQTSKNTTYESVKAYTKMVSGSKKDKKHN